MRIQKTGVAGVVPAICGQHFSRGLWIFEIALEQARRLNQNLAVVGHLDLDALAWHAHSVGTRFVVGLQADKHRRFRGAIQLLQVDTNRAVKTEQVRANGFTGGVGHTHPAETQVVAQRAIDHEVAQRIQHAVGQAHRFAVHQRRADALGHAHEVVKHLALEGARVFHADHHAGEQTLEHARRRKVIGGADFLQVDADGGGIFGAVHHVAAAQPLRIAKNVLPDPGRWQVGQHVFLVGQLVELGTGAGAVEQGVMRVHHALGIAGGARGKKQRCHVVRLDGVHRRLEKPRVLRDKIFALGDQVVERLQTRLVVIAQAARIVEIKPGHLRTLVADFEQLVHLLLVFGKGKGHVGVVDREHALLGGGILVQRNWHCTQRLHCQHGGIQARAIGADHHHVVMLAQTGLVQTASQMRHHHGQVGPADGLPDAVLFFTHGRVPGALGGVV